MKYVLIVLLCLVMSGFSQLSVKNYPAYHMAKEVFNGLIDADGVTTDPVEMGQYKNVTLFLIGDTTGASEKSANQSDSCLTINYQIKNELRGAWTTATKIDTIDRALINVAGTVLNILEIVLPDSIPYGDYTRFTISAGVGDSLNLKFDFGGQ